LIFVRIYVKVVAMRGKNHPANSIGYFKRMLDSARKNTRPGFGHILTLTQPWDKIPALQQLDLRHILRMESPNGHSTITTRLMVAGGGKMPIPEEIMIKDGLGRARAHIIYLDRRSDGGDGFHGFLEIHNTHDAEGTPIIPTPTIRYLFVTLGITPPPRR
jgi:hypothetical protein